MGYAEFVCQVAKILYVVILQLFSFERVYVFGMNTLWYVSFYSNLKGLQHFINYILVLEFPGVCGAGPTMSFRFNNLCARALKICNGE